MASNGEDGIRSHIFDFKSGSLSRTKMSRFKINSRSRCWVGQQIFLQKASIKSMSVSLYAFLYTHFYSRFTEDRDLAQNHY